MHSAMFSHKSLGCHDMLRWLPCAFKAPLGLSFFERGVKNVLAYRCLKLGTVTSSRIKCYKYVAKKKFHKVYAPMIL